MKSARRAAALLCCLLLAACAADTPAPDCSASGQWRAGQASAALDPRCSGEDARQAHTLGAELASLRAEFDAIGLQLKSADAANAGALTRRQRQLQIDIEAIEGVAKVQGW
jgi:hypothetical protein